MKEKINVYIKEKAQLLYELGLSNRHAVAQYLTTETKDITDQARLECKVDRLAHTLILQYYDGDTTFSNVNIKGTKDPILCYNKLKDVYSEVETISEKAIVNTIGATAFSLLKRQHYIKPCGKANGCKLYALHM